MMMSTVALLLALLGPKSNSVAPAPVATQGHLDEASAQSLAAIESLFALHEDPPRVAKLSTRAQLARVAGVAFETVTRPVVLSLARPRVGAMMYAAYQVAITDPSNGNAVFRRDSAADDRRGGVRLSFDVQMGRTYVVECATTTATWSIESLVEGGASDRTLGGTVVYDSERPSMSVSASEDTRIKVYFTPGLGAGEQAEIGRCQIAAVSTKG